MAGYGGHPSLVLELRGALCKEGAGSRPSAPHAYRGCHSFTHQCGLLTREPEAGVSQPAEVGDRKSQLSRARSSRSSGGARAHCAAALDHLPLGHVARGGAAG